MFLQYDQIRTNVRAEQEMRDMRSRRAAAIKQAKRRFHRMICAAVLLSLILTSALFIGLRLSERTAAAQGMEETRVKCYRSMLIERDDSLWSIAEREMSRDWSDPRAFISEVMEINGLSGSEIKAGNYLILPYYL